MPCSLPIALVRLSSLMFHSPGWGGRWALEAEILGDDFVHDLVGSAADPQDAGVAVEALDFALTHVAHAAVDLNGLVHHEVASVDGRVLRHGRLLGHVLPGHEAAGHRPPCTARA